MGESGFAKKIGDALGRPIDGACAARPKGTLTFAPIVAGVGAGIGVVVGGPIAAGIGGGVGALVGFAIAAWRARRLSPPLAANMALVLDERGFELYAVGWTGTRPTDRLIAATYAEVASVALGENWLGVWAEVALRSGERVEIEAGKRGIGAGKEVLAALRERSEGASAGAAGNSA